MTQVLYKWFQAKVLYEEDMTESFEMGHGCLLSPLLFLFLVALNLVARQAFGDNKTGIQVTLFLKLEDPDVADDHAP